ncbi:plastocyanin/azurin family copper-binding protein [Polyangium spumosum]|nr:plastocyanin/azurin family copper-binding protein [Polyangium spumosum]
MTGVSHTPINPDDGNACTVDACDPRTGVSHTPVNPDDGNACTVDACDPMTGVSHTPVINDGNPCTADSCDPMTGVSNTPLPAGTDCGMGKQCDGMGQCTGCIDAFDCPGQVTECRAPTCTNGICGTIYAPAGTPLSTESSGDCKRHVCDGMGAAIVEDDAMDEPDDNNSCTLDACLAGAPTHLPVALGTTCTDGGGTVCDDNGTCVACNVDADCMNGDVCMANACVAPATCMDGIMNGDETGVDCGGAMCLKCNGDACGSDAECQSGICSGGMCVANINGCTPSMATDLTAMSATTVTFSSLSYTPKCIKVKAGTVVTFSGSFANHPLQGGYMDLANLPTPAASGPFVPVTDAGTSKGFTLSTQGTYPFYCVPHASLGMNGAVFVVP